MIIDSDDVEFLRDDVLYCYKCKADYINACDKHKTVWKPDRLKHCNIRNLPDIFKWYLNSISSDNKCDCSHNLENHIKKSMPTALNLTKLEKNQNSYKIITNNSVKKGTIFGPILGDIKELEDDDDKSDFYERSINGSGWFIRKSMMNHHNSFINFENDFQANWMKYVRSTPNCEFQNLIVIQYYGFLFFRACVDIPPKTELLTHFSVQHERDFELSKGRKYDTPLVIKKSKSNEPFYKKAKVHKSKENTKKVSQANMQSSNLSNSHLITTTSVVNQQNSNDSSMITNKMPSENLSQPITHLPKVCSILPPPKHSISHILSSNNHENNTESTLNYLPYYHHTFQPTYNYGYNLNACPDPYIPNQLSAINTDITESTNDNMPPPKSTTTIKRKRSSLIENNQAKNSKNKSNNIASSSSMTSSSLDSFNFENDKENQPSYIFPTPVPSKLLIDNNEKLSSYIKRICCLEPYLSLENIIDMICRKFPLISLVNYEPISIFINRHRLRLRSGLWSDPNDQMISMIVKMFEENIQLNGEQVQNRLCAIFPGQQLLDLSLIEDIVKCNFSKKSINDVDSDVLEFIRLMIKSRHNTYVPIEQLDYLVTELQFAVQVKYPTRFRVSRIVIDELLKLHAGSIEENPQQNVAPDSFIKNEPVTLDFNQFEQTSSEYSTNLGNPHLALETQKALECLDNEEI